MLLNKELKVLREFLREKDSSIYGSFISKKLKENQKTISNILNRLEKQNILKYKLEGKNKYYSLNRLNPAIKEIVKMVELNNKVLFLQDNPSLARLFQELEKKTEGILLIFGSYASGRKNKSSDLDIFLIGKIENIKDLEESYSIKINLVKSSKEQFDLGENFIKEIMQNHIILKGVEDFTDLWFH